MAPSPPTPPLQPAGRSDNRIRPAFACLAAVILSVFAIGLCRLAVGEFEAGRVLYHQRGSTTRVLFEFGRNERPVGFWIVLVLEFAFAVAVATCALAMLRIATTKKKNEA